MVQGNVLLDCGAAAEVHGEFEFVSLCHLLAWVPCNQLFACPEVWLWYAYFRTLKFMKDEFMNYVILDSA